MILVAAVLGGIVSAFGQAGVPTGGPGGNSGSGIGTINTGCQATGGGSTPTVTVATDLVTGAVITASQQDNAGWCGEQILGNATTGQTLTLENLPGNNYFRFVNENTGSWTLAAGVGTTIIAGCTMVAHNQSVDIQRDGNNNWTIACGVGGSTGLTVGSTSITGGTNGDIEYNNSGVLGEKGVTGSGNVVLATSPTLTAPNIGAATGASLDGAAIGSVTPSTGAFTTLSASGAISGAGWTSSLASPPAIGGTAAAAGTFTTLTDTIALVGPIIAPATDSTTAIQIMKSNQSTRVVDVDTTNARVGINKTPGAFDLDVNGAANFGSTIAVANGATASVFSAASINANAADIILSGRNTSTGTAAQVQIELGNSTGIAESSIFLNGGSFTGVGGANATTINNAAGKMAWLNAGANVMDFGVTTASAWSLPTIATDATHTDATLCEDTTSHTIYFGSGTAGVCLGTSSARFKRDIAALDLGIWDIMHLAPKSYFYREGYGDNGARRQGGFVAEDVIDVLPKLVGLDAEGKPNTVDMMGLVPILVKAAQEEQEEIAVIFALLLLGALVFVLQQRQIAQLKRQIAARH